MNGVISPGQQRWQRIILFVAPLALCLAAPAQEEENRVVNGGFEDLWTGWSRYSSAAIGEGAAEGKIFAICGIYAQDVRTEPGRRYRLRFACGGTEFEQPSRGPLEISWASNVVATLSRVAPPRSQGRAWDP